MMKRRLLKLAALTLFMVMGFAYANAQGRAKVTAKEGQNLDQTFTFQLSYIDGMIQADLQEEAFLANRMIGSLTINESTQEVTIVVKDTDAGVNEVHDFLQSYLDTRYSERNPAGYGPEDFQSTRN